MYELKGMSINKQVLNRSLLGIILPYLFPCGAPSWGEYLGGPIPYWLFPIGFGRPSPSGPRCAVAYNTGCSLPGQIAKGHQTVTKNMRIFKPDQDFFHDF